MVTEEEVTEKYNINDFLVIYFIILYNYWWKTNEKSIKTDEYGN